MIRLEFSAKECAQQIASKILHDFLLAMSAFVLVVMERNDKSNTSSSYYDPSKFASPLCYAFPVPFSSCRANLQPSDN